MDDLWFPAVSGYSQDVWFANFGQDSSFGSIKTAQGNTDSNGKGDFYYTPPSGYLALCTANLPAPTVKPKEHFNTVLYTGNGSTINVTGVGFRPDMVWTKNRAETYNHTIWDSTRGVQKEIFPNTDDDEQNEGSASLTSFNADGFTHGSRGNSNESNDAIVSWHWKFNGGTTSTNNNGNAASTVQVNSDAKMSIVQYEGTGSAQTVGHGLGVKPAFVLIKNFDTTVEWVVWHKSFSVNEYMRFNEQTGIYTASSGGDFWPNGITTSVIGLGAHSGNNQTGMTIIAYCFTEVDGWFSTGRYNGNGSTDGPFIYTGFSPAWLIIKRTGNHAGVLLDVVRSPQNVNNNGLELGNSNGESADEVAFNVDILSNGFKVRSAEGTVNNGSGNYIYYAFAEFPFNFANAR